MQKGIFGEDKRGKGIVAIKREAMHEEDEMALTWLRLQTAIPGQL